jgi:hypothetical protein
LVMMFMAGFSSLWFLSRREGRHLPNQSLRTGKSRKVKHEHNDISSGNARGFTWGREPAEGCGYD